MRTVIESAERNRFALRGQRAGTLARGSEQPHPDEGTRQESHWHWRHRRPLFLIVLTIPRPRRSHFHDRIRHEIEAGDAHMTVDSRTLQHSGPPDIVLRIIPGWTPQPGTGPLFGSAWNCCPGPTHPSPPLKAGRSRRVGSSEPRIAGARDKLGLLETAGVVTPKRAPKNAKWSRITSLQGAPEVDCPALPRSQHHRQVSQLLPADGVPPSACDRDRVRPHRAAVKAVAAERVDIGAAKCSSVNRDRVFAANPGSRNG